MIENENQTLGNVCPRIKTGAFLTKIIHKLDCASSKIMDVLLDLLTTNIASDSKILDEVLAQINTRCKINNAYFISESDTSFAGWRFARVSISDGFFHQIMTLFPHINTIKIESAKGVYFTAEKNLLQLTTWLNQILKEKTSTAQIKIAKEMADFGY